MALTGSQKRKEVSVIDFGNKF